MRRLSLANEYLVECQEIESPADYAQFYTRLKNAAQNLDANLPQQQLESLNIKKQAKAFLLFAALSVKPDTNKLKAALTTDDPALVTAAAFCYTICCVENDKLQRELLLGKTAWVPSSISKHGRFQLIKFMGLSRNNLFKSVLFDALLEHGHFCPQYSTANALNALGYSLADVTMHEQSISIDVGVNREMLLTIDEKFTGSSNCPDCRYFPCRINRHYPGGIQDCSLWNKTNPNSLGEIRDLRHKAEQKNISKVNLLDKTAWRHTMVLMEQAHFLEAIPLLCTILSNDFQQRAAIAWVYLADCFSAYGEDKLAFIAMREAVKNKEYFQLPEQQEALLQTALFENDPKQVLGEYFTTRNPFQTDEKAITYKNRGCYTLALDLYLNENIYVTGKYASEWFEMGVCHRKLGELHLAELFMRHAVLLTDSTIGIDPDFRLNKRFSEVVAEVYQEKLISDDPGLNLERRREERLS